MKNSTYYFKFFILLGCLTWSMGPFALSLKQEPKPTTIFSAKPTTIPTTIPTAKADPKYDNSLTLSFSKDKIATMAKLTINRIEDPSLMKALKDHPSSLVLGKMLQLISLGSEKVKNAKGELEEKLFLYCAWIKNYSSIGTDFLKTEIESTLPLDQKEHPQGWIVHLYFSAPVMVKEEKIEPKLSFLAMNWTPTFWESYRKEITASLFLLGLVFIFALFIWPIPQLLKRGSKERLYQIQKKYWEKKLFLAQERFHFDDLWQKRKQWFFLVSPELREHFTKFSHQFLYLPSWDEQLKKSAQQFQREFLTQKEYWLKSAEVSKEELLYFNRQRELKFKRAAKKGARP